MDLQRPKQWLWGSFEKKSMQLSEDGLTVCKTADDPDYSCAVGSEEFHDGIHFWDVWVDNVTSMWLGISNGLEEHNGLDAPAGLDDSASYLLAFSNRGTITFIGKEPFEIRRNQSPPGFHSGQLVQFVLDTGAHTLKIKIDNDPEIEVTNIEDLPLRPFVCMDDSESSASLHLRAYRVSNTLATQDEVSMLNAATAEDNAFWKDDFNLKLLEFVLEGTRI